MKPPLVTICLITYNYATLLEKAVQSLINQSYPNTQIIISDDQSTDNTEQVVHKIQSKNPEVIYRKNIRDLKTMGFHDVSTKNILTAKKTFDAAFNHCNSIITSGVISGEFVIFCHQDDIYHHDIVKKELEFLLTHPDIPAVFTLGNIVNEQDKIIGTYKLPPELKGRNVYAFKEIFNAILNHGNTFLIAPTFMARIKIFDIFRRFFENITLLRTKVLILKIILFLGINLGLGKYLGKILYRFV